jgi:uncharacterized phiE125 gp8 family phage protein
MPVTVITPPAPVISLVDAKKHLRVEHGDDDTYIEGLIAAATEWIDGNSEEKGWLGRSLGLQTLEMTAADFCSGYIVLPYPPIVDIVAVQYVDADGVTQTMASDQYRLSGRRDLMPLAGAAWPYVRCEDAVRIQYRAGYGSFDTAEPPVWTPALPKPIWAAILMLVGQWYQSREPVVLGATVETLPFAVDALLSTFRVYR